MIKRILKDPILRATFLFGALFGSFLTAITTWMYLH